MTITIETDGTKTNTTITVGDHSLENWTALQVKSNARKEGCDVVVKMPSIVIKKNKEGAGRPAVVQQEFDLTSEDGASGAVENDRYWIENTEVEDADGDDDSVATDDSE